MEQHDAFVPGTIHLVDLDGTSSAQHSSTGQKDIILVPAPSSDPDDPLNWSFRRKTLLTSCLCMYTLMVGIGETAISSVLIPISMRSGLSLNDLNAGTGYMYLLLGWGCLFWQPLALQYGKRPVYLISIFAQIGLMVWAPYTKSNGEWIANKILQGFFGAPIEALCESSVTDVYFTHQRGLYLSIYALFVVSGGYCAPVMAGFITDGQSWEWVLYWAAIFNAIGFVYLFFFMEETNYSRQVIAGREESTSDIRYPDGQHEASKAPPREDCKNISDSVSSTEEGQQTIQLPKKRYLQKLRLFEPGTFSKPVLLKGMFLRPLIYLSFPVIAWPGFCYGTGLIWFNLLNGTSSLIFSGPPYGFAPSMVGLTYLSPVIGGILGAIFCGKFGNWFVLKLARRNRGVMEPENRLWLFSFPLLLYPFGLILYGVGAAYGVHWFGLVFAMGVMGAVGALGAQVCLSYPIDSYRELSGEAMVTIVIIRNTMAFAVGYGITPWVVNMGYRNAFIVAAFAAMAQASTFLIFIKWGKKMRVKSTAKYLKYVGELKSAGLMH